MLPLLITLAAVAQTTVVEIQTTGGVERRRAEVIDGWLVIDGDVLVGREAEAGETAAPAPVAQADLWPRGEIPYAPGGLLADAILGPKIVAAMQVWSAPTGLVFRPKRDDDTRWISFQAWSGDACEAARVGSGVGDNPVTLATGCASQLVHELGHVIGLHHEHQRKDRDAWIKVVTDNIAASKRRAFDRYANLPESQVGSPYDRRSVMHYGARAFARTALNDEGEDVRLVTIALPTAKAPNARGFLAAEDEADALAEIQPSPTPTESDLDRVRRLYSVQLAARNAGDQGDPGSLPLTPVDPTARFLAGLRGRVALPDAHATRASSSLAPAELAELADALRAMADAHRFDLTDALAARASSLLGSTGGRALERELRAALGSDGHWRLDALREDAPAPRVPPRAAAGAVAIDGRTLYTLDEGALSVRGPGGLPRTITRGFTGSVVAADDGRILWQEPDGTLRAARVESGELRGIHDVGWLGAGEAYGVIDGRLQVRLDGRELEMVIGDW